MEGRIRRAAEWIRNHRPQSPEPLAVEAGGAVPRAWALRPPHPSVLHRRQWGQDWERGWPRVRERRDQRLQPCFCSGVGAKGGRGRGRVKLVLPLVSSPFYKKIFKRNTQLF